jgi:hypothetical protein
MEYSTINSSNSINLGNSQHQGVLLSSLNSNSYTNNKPTTSVVFKPEGNFLAPLVDDNNGYSFTELSNNQVNNEDSDGNDDSDDEDDSKFNFLNDPINTFFIGSITVVGLFVLFRLLQKNR